VIIAMARPWRHPDTGVYYYRARVPAAVLATHRGISISIEVAGELTKVGLGDIVKLSLRTKNIGEARLRHVSVQKQLEQRWASAKGKPVRLTKSEISGLTGIWYRDLVLMHQDDPGSVDGWEAYQDLLYDGLAPFNKTRDDCEREPYDPKEGYRRLGRLFDIDEFLTQRGLVITDESREELVQEVAWTLVNACETLIRRANGDFGADKYAERFAEPPQIGRAAVSRRTSDGITISALFEGWAKESAPRQETIDEWRRYVQRFIDFIGHDDARSVTRADVVRWKQHLLELNNSPKTINGSKLAALKVTFGWGVANELCPTNPADKVSVRRSSRPGDEMRGFSISEARIILAAAAIAKDDACRWVPRLCAQSGARVGEVCQLRVEDIRREGDIWFMDLRAEAGSLKNKWSERKVPLHSSIAEEFVDFAKARGSGPLFYDPAKRRAGAKKPQAKIVAKRVANWVHTLGLNVGKGARKAPNHAWRHFFRTMARDAKVADSVASAILGHRPATVGETYGETRLSTMAEAIESMALTELLRQPSS
jgi:integrase